MPIRDLVLFLVIAVAVPVIFVHPYVGVLFWAWVGLMNPHRLTFGPAYSFPFAFVIAIATLAGLVFTKDERRWKAGPEVYVLIVFVVWMSITTVFALDPASAYEKWTRVIKIQAMVFVALIVLNSKRHIDLLVWVLAVSIGFYGVKGGIFTILTGGQSRVWGPADSFIEDNNALALAVVMTIPLLYYLFSESKQRWIRIGLVIAMVLCAFSALGSQSRGALLAISAMAFLLWLRSHHKVVLGGALAIVAPTLFMFMPDKWDQRMGTIVEYEGEGSAMARIHAWQTLWKLANDRFMGGGFEFYSPEVYAQYESEANLAYSAHSIYFQVLGEHGFLGLALFLLIWILTWRSSRQLIKAAEGRPELGWAKTLGSMVQVSLLAYLVGGAFQNLAYWDFPYYEIVLLVIMRDIVRRTQPQQNAAALTGAPRPGVTAWQPTRTGEQ